MTTLSELSAEDRELILAALASTRGHYSADRAGQLSGVPTRTVYDWGKKQILVPDHTWRTPMAWSYRDLVLLRLIAFLRQHRVELSDAAALAHRYKREFTSGRADRIETRISAAEGGYAIGPKMPVDALTGQQAFDLMADISGHFDLMVTLDSHDQLRKLHGPNLVRPSARTTISPWVLGGEPVIKDSRIGTATIAALHEDRLLSPSDVALLYPSISIKDVEDAIEMERRLRLAA